MGKKDKNQPSKTKAGDSSVKSCSCEHSYQDKRNGKGQRLKIAQADGKWECTVCGRS